MMHNMLPYLVFLTLVDTTNCINTNLWLRFYRLRISFLVWWFDKPTKNMGFFRFTTEYKLLIKNSEYRYQTSLFPTQILIFLHTIMWYMNNLTSSMKNIVNARLLTNGAYIVHYYFLFPCYFLFLHSISTYTEMETMHYVDTSTDKIVQFLLVFFLFLLKSISLL